MNSCRFCVYNYTHMCNISFYCKSGTEVGWQTTAMWGWKRDGKSSQEIGYCGCNSVAAKWKYLHCRTADFHVESTQSFAVKQTHSYSKP